MEKGEENNAYGGMPPKAVRGRSKPLLRQSVGDEPSARLAGEKKQKKSMHWCTAKGRIMHLFFVLSLCLYSVHLFLFYLSLALIVSDLAAPKYPSGPQRIEYFVKFQMQIWSKFSCTFGGKIQMFLLNTDATVGVPSERDSRRQCGSRPARSCSQVARRPAITLALPAKNEGEFSVYSWLRLAHDLMC